MRFRTLVKLALVLGASGVFAPECVLAGTGYVSGPNGHTFVTVGAPGNRGMLESERYYNLPGPPNGPGPGKHITTDWGRVDYEYRMGVTEVTVGQWFEFIKVAYPVWRELGFNHSSSDFMGLYTVNTAPPNSPANYQIGLASVLPQILNTPQQMQWRAAAMYCNWMHHGAPTGPNVDLSVFRTGAYDVSTFRRNPDGTYSDQITKSEGALYWIPDLDEWTKAAYYDPNRYGNGKEGYWYFPYQSQERPVPGNPGEGEAYGTMVAGGTDYPLEVGSYPDVHSPWGLLDLAGGVREWTETVPNPAFINEYGLVTQTGNRLFKGDSWSQSTGGIALPNDGLGGSAGFFGGSNGFRLAAAVPGPASGAMLGLGLAVVHRRERRRK